MNTNMDSQYWDVYLVGEKVLVPTQGRTVNGLGLSIDPMVVVSILEPDVLRRTILDTIARGNPTVQDPGPSFKTDMHKKVGMRSYKAFERASVSWDITKKGGIYSICFWKFGIEHGKGFTPDTSKPDNVFPPNTPVETVVDRLIEIIMQTYQEKKKEVTK